MPAGRSSKTWSFMAALRISLMKSTPPPATTARNAVDSTLASVPNTNVRIREGGPMASFRRAAGLVAGLAAMVIHGSAWAAPQRVVSLSPCLDVILVNVADRDQIAALSHFSREDTSTI